MLNDREQRSKIITEVIFYTKVLVNDNLVGLERILDNAGVRLDAGSLIKATMSSRPSQKSQTSLFHQLQGCSTLNQLSSLIDMYIISKV